MIDLKAELLQARKNKNTVATKALSSLLADTDPKLHKKVPDLMSLVRKYIANGKDNAGIEDSRGNFVKAKEYLKEVAFLESLLPVQMTEDDILDAISGCPFEGIGPTMGFLKKNYAGQYDPKLASKVIRETK